MILACSNHDYVNVLNPLNIHISIMYFIILLLVYMKTDGEN